MKRLGSLPLAYQPGEKWLYHTGSDVLGVLMARVTGQPLAEFLQERLFGPLGMEDTGFHVPADKLAGFPRRTVPIRDGHLGLRRSGRRADRDPADPAGDDLPGSARRVPRFLDLRLPGRRRLARGGGTVSCAAPAS